MVVLFDRAYWTRVINFEALVEAQMIDRDDLRLFSFAEDAEEIWTRLLAGGLKVPAPTKRR